MEKHECKICDKRFASGRALGGHMRSHLSKFPLPTSPNFPRESVEHPPERPSTPSEEADSSRTPAQSRPRRKRPRRRSPEEDVALCLMMLSRDSRAIPEEQEQQEDGEIEKPAARSEFRCATCERMFKSYQALGGHRASHKKIKIQLLAAADTGSDDHPHRRQGEATTSSSRSGFNKFIDLNLPAPLGDDDDDFGHFTAVSVIRG